MKIKIGRGGGATWNDENRAMIAYGYKAFEYLSALMPREVLKLPSHFLNRQRVVVPKNTKDSHAMIGTSSASETIEPSMAAGLRKCNGN
ncbi:conserved hypothetical protein [Ricinus communis]|uniref:Uncharacterized protein n=1 Tax=Ricinus communis TaxID=3988 RepID=B9SR89_RICCO|nr:conserved hypothetical protein [Ricinus communis]